MTFNLQDYAEVKDRIPVFWKRYPDGRIVTEQTMFDLESGTVEFVCYLYRDHETEKPVTTGWAYEVVGSSPVNRTSAVENCETSAIGRALANMGIHGKNGTEPRPSREEMQKVVRQNVEPVPELLNEPIRFGKHQGATWAEVLETDRAYAHWAVENAKRMGEDLRATLKAELAAPEETDHSSREDEESSGAGGTASGAPANKGQIAALRAAYGSIVVGLKNDSPKIAGQIEAVINGTPTEKEVTDWITWCEQFGGEA